MVGSSSLKNPRNIKKWFNEVMKYLKKSNLMASAISKPADPSPSNTELAFERTLLAHERTLMAWIRTSISMISFGFTIYKIFEERSKTPEGQNSLLTPRVVGMIMISFGLLALLLAQIQHTIAIRKIKKNYPAIQSSLSSILSVMVLIFGLVLFLAAVFRQ
jgi:putative membrane protein